MRMMSYNASRTHNINTYDYVKTEAPILRNFFGNQEFTFGDYEKVTKYFDGAHYRHRGLSLSAALDWGFVEVVRQEPRCMKEEDVLITTRGERICSVEEYRKMDKKIADAITTAYGPFVYKKMCSPANDQYRNIYRWNEENYRRWLDKGRDMINDRTRHEIRQLNEEIKRLESEMI